MPFLTELAERDATGSTRAIYDEMKRLGGLPMVALIFRHLATLPGGLEWAWDAIGPSWKDGHLQEEAWRIANAAPIDAIGPITREALVALGVDEAGLREIHIVADAYNVANPVNLLSVTCLARLLGGGRGSVEQPARAWTPPAAPGPLVPMIDVATMPRAVANLLDLVASGGAVGEPRLVPSLYRHFGHRPPFLALLVTLLMARFDDGSIERSVRTIRASMAAAAEDLVRGMSAPPAPAAGIAIAFDRFGAMIPRMIVVGRLLKESLPVASTSGFAR